MPLMWRSKTKEFERTAVPHLAAVYRFARQLDESRAQDLTQETFLRGWKYFGSYKPETNCRAWLFRILRNVWSDHYRRNRLEVSLDEGEYSEVEPYYDWEGEFLRNEMSPELESALELVPANYRWALLLADVEELSYQEIAQIMECPIGTVMSRINRGRRTLARLLHASSELVYESEKAAKIYHGDK